MLTRASSFEGNLFLRVPASTSLCAPVVRTFFDLLPLCSTVCDSVVHLWFGLPLPGLHQFNSPGPFRHLVPFRLLFFVPLVRPFSSSAATSSFFTSRSLYPLGPRTSFPLLLFCFSSVFFVLRIAVGLTPPVVFYVVRSTSRFLQVVTYPGSFLLRPVRLPRKRTSSQPFPFVPQQHHLTSGPSLLPFLSRSAFLSP